MLERLLKLIELEQTRIANNAMAAPSRELFDHGVNVGQFQGLNLAKELISRTLNEADEKERELERYR